ncbi:MAG: ornithine cyclodeaminase family protein [Anaerolineae bacterium]|jgi:ornithine cyclodeaminase|nr:ornithine cyclodeaminase family protein [Anaerolineae bacterium]
MSKPVELLFLSQEDVIAAGGLDIKATVDALVKVYTLLGQGQAQDPVCPQIQYDNDQSKRFQAVHPAWLAGDVNITGMKVGCRMPDNPRTIGYPTITAVTIITDPVSGHPFAIMDASFLTAMRTGGTTGVALRYLGRRDYRSAALLGAGVMQRAQAMAIDSECPQLEDARVYDIFPEKAERFIHEMKDLVKMPMRVVESAEAAVRGADVIAPSTVVSVRDSYIQADWIKPGALMANVSDNDYTFGAVQKADRIVYDGHKQFGIPVTLGEMVKAGLLDPEKDAVAMGDVVTGKAPGRTRDDQVIFFSALGMGLYDLMVGYRVYQKAKEIGVGTPLKLWNDPYWL